MSSTDAGRRTGSGPAVDRRQDRGGAGVRYAVGGLGVIVGLWGAWLIFGTADFADLINIAVWLGGGIVFNDGIIAAIALVLGFVAMRLLPRLARGPAAVGFVVVGTFSVLAIPFLGRFGAREDNATLLNRDYVGGYLLFVAIVAVLAIVTAMWRMGRTGPDGVSPPR